MVASDHPAMARFSAHIGYLFTELPLADRIRAAAEAGFVAVEHPAPGQIPAAEMRKLLAGGGVTFAQMGVAAGDPARGEKGLAALPEARQRFREAVLTGLDYAAEIGCRLVHPMSGVLPGGVSLEALWAGYLENMAFVADEAARRGLVMLIEPIGPGTLPNYAIAETQVALDAISALSRSNVSLLFDVFHGANEGLDPAEVIAAHGAVIGHVHLADRPGRHEPGSGALDFNAIREALAGVSYRGLLGCEYIPSGRTTDNLGWMKDWAP